MLGNIFNISSFLLILLTVCDISNGKPVKSKDLQSPAATAVRPRALWDDLFSYFDDTSSEEEEDVSSEEEPVDNWSNEKPQSQSDQNRKYEFCRDCNVSYLNINSTQYINNYNQVTTEKANGKPTPEATTTMKTATKNGAATKDTTQTTVSPKAIITTTTTPATQTTLLTNTSTTPKSSKDIQVGMDSDSDNNATPTVTTTTTTTITTTKSVDMTTIPPAPVPLDDEPLLEPSDKMPSEEALTSEENV